MESLGIDIKLLIAQLTNFFLFFFIFKKFIAKPFSVYLKEEKQKDKEKEILLIKAQEKEENLKNEEKKLKDKLKKEYQQSLNQAKKEVKLMQEKLIDEAKREAQEILEKSRKQIEEERKKLEKEIKNRALELSIIMAKQFLANYLDKDTQKKINEKIFKEIVKKVN